MAYKQDIKDVYSKFGLFNARWYDQARALWTNLASRKAEANFTKLLIANIKPSSEILHLCRGTGINLERILNSKKRFRSYTGVDFSDDMLKIARKKFPKIENVALIRRDITKPSAKKYDIIISTWVMSHLEEQSKIIDSYARRLNKKGILLFVFLTKPVWYIDFWFHPILRLFACEPVSEDEIQKIRFRKDINKYSLGITTLLMIRGK